MCEAGHEDGYEWLGMNGARAREGLRRGRMDGGFGW